MIIQSYASAGELVLFEWRGLSDKKCADHRLKTITVKKAKKFAEITLNRSGISPINRSTQFKMFEFKSGVQSWVELLVLT